MSTDPNQSKGKQSDTSNTYGGYGGYTPRKPSDDPYGAYNRPQPATSGGQSSDPDYVYGQQQSSGNQQQQQQYQTSGSYQPPQSVRNRGRSSGAHDSTSLGLNARLASVLSYLLGPFSGLFFFIFERKNGFVRFNAAQSIVLFGPVFIALFLIQFLVGITSGIFFVGFLFSSIFGCLSTILVIAAGLLMLFLMLQSYRGVRVKLPFVGDYAEGLLQRFSRKSSI